MSKQGKSRLVPRLVGETTIRLPVPAPVVKRKVKVKDDELRVLPGGDELADDDYGDDDDESGPGDKPKKRVSFVESTGPEFAAARKIAFKAKLKPLTGRKTPRLTRVVPRLR